MSVPLSDEALCRTFLYQTLAGDSQITAVVGVTSPRVYAKKIPQGVTTWPCIYFAKLGGQNTVALGGEITLARHQWKVAVADKASSLTGIDALMDRVHTLLHTASMTFGNGRRVDACTELQPAMDIADPDLGVEYSTLIAVYELITSRT